MNSVTTLHPEELALLREVCRVPDDDTSRLVLADWYTETGEPLLTLFAAFIRQQVADDRLSVEAGQQNAADDPSHYMIGSAPWKRERARSSLVTPVAGSNLRGSEGNYNAGNLWAARLFGIDNASGYTNPLMWDRGFPAVASFGSYLQWERSAQLYARVPLVRSKVRGRHPAGNYGSGFLWFRRSVHFGRTHESNLPPEVFDRLPSGTANPSRESTRYASRQLALKDAELAFTDAGRFACGLPRRHLKRPQLVSEQFEKTAAEPTNRRNT